MLETKKIDYQCKGTTFEAYYAGAITTKSQPAVMIVHDWSGRNDFVCQQAEALAKIGYVGIAIDMYGKGKIGTTTEEKMTLMQPLIQDRDLLRQRILAALDTVKTLPTVDHNKIAAIGYCFGGLCVLDLARSGAAIRGVVSFHGLLSAPTLPKHSIQAKVLVLHGHADPMIPAEQLVSFCNEMDNANVDWQIHTYSQTKHAFTNPQANDSALGTLYNPIAAQRAWIAMQNFLAEIFV